MPERNERFFWIHGKDLTPGQITDIEKELNNFKDEWNKKMSKYVTHLTNTINNNSSKHQLWLLRFKSKANKIIKNDAKDLEKEINVVIENLISSLDLTDKHLELETTHPTPLFSEPIKLGTWAKCDIGLLCVNDEYNGTIMSRAYWIGRFGIEQPLNLQLYELKKLIDEVKKFCCDCYKNKSCSYCNGEGCYMCFDLNCQKCEGTGWKDFSKWKSGGYKIDYSSGCPIAITS